MPRHSSAWRPLKEALQDLKSDSTSDSHSETLKKPQIYSQAAKHDKGSNDVALKLEGTQRSNLRGSCHGC